LAVSENYNEIASAPQVIKDNKAFPAHRNDGTGWLCNKRMKEDSEHFPPVFARRCSDFPFLLIFRTEAISYPMKPGPIKPRRSFAGSQLNQSFEKTFLVLAYYKIIAMRLLLRGKLLMIISHSRRIAMTEPGGSAIKE
jgi:hypothetical protein